MTANEIVLVVLVALGVCGIGALIFAMVVFGNKSPWDPDL